MLKNVAGKKSREEVTWESTVTRFVMLRCIMKKALEIMWNGLIWLRIRSSGGLLECSNASSGCMTHRDVWRSQEIHFKRPFFLRLFLSRTTQFCEHVHVCKYVQAEVMNVVVCVCVWSVCVWCVCMCANVCRQRL